MYLSGKLLKNLDGEYCIEMQISPENPQFYEIPLSEFLDPLLNQNVSMDVEQLVRRWEAHK
jgi:hypothetical protein